MLKTEENPVFAAVRTGAEFDAALTADVNVIFSLCTPIKELESMIKRAHENNKYIFIHADMTEGISRDKAGIEYIAGFGADGIISTHSALVRFGKELGLKVVQRFFFVDSQSVKTAKSTLKTFRPDMVEIMPASSCGFIADFCRELSIPLIAGGLITEKKDIINALSAGAEAVSTGKKELWNE